MNRATTAALLAMTLGTVVHLAARDEVLRSIDWKALTAARALTAGVVSADGNLRLAHSKPGEALFHLVTIERPGITSPRYAIRGRLKYDQVAAGSYLEMLNHVGGESYFSRTLDDGGPMGQISGSSTWREFILPFLNRENEPPPEKLVVNLVLRGAGTVEITRLELVQFGPGEPMAATVAGWWNERTAGLLGAIIGSTMGVLGALIGALGSVGRGRTFVIVTLRVLGILGLVSFGAGVVALAAGQPYGVFYPLLLLGTISAVVGLTLPRAVIKRYEALELRRIQALDA